MKLKNARMKLVFAALPLSALMVSLTLHAMARPRLDDQTVLEQADARPPGEPRLDPNLHDQLLQALNPEPTRLPQPIRNPFLDRTGLLRAGTNQSTAGTGINRPPFNPMIGPGGATAAAGAVDADSRPLKPFAERYRELQRQSAQAQSEGRAALPVISIYSITEIEIYGHAQAGRAWVYGKPEDRAFTIAPGAQLLDGTFVSFDRDDAVFRTRQGRTIKLPLSREN